MGASLNYYFIWNFETFVTSWTDLTTTQFCNILELSVDNHL